MALKLAALVQSRKRFLRRDRNASGLFNTAEAMETAVQHSCQDPISINEGALKEQVMSRKRYSVTKQLAVAVAAALAFGASGIAAADDSSIGRFGGDSYGYF